jgi:hypothetical protein
MSYFTRVCLDGFVKNVLGIKLKFKYLTLKKYYKNFLKKYFKWRLGKIALVKKIIDPSLKMLAMIAASSAVVIELRLLEQILQLCLVSMSTIRAVSAKAAIMLMLR